MENDIGILGIIVENNSMIENINACLHEYGSYIIGRLGVPYHEKKMNVIAVVFDAPKEIINDVNKKINKLDGIQSKMILF